MKRELERRIGGILEKDKWKQIAEVVGKVGGELSRKQKAEQIVGNRKQNSQSYIAKKILELAELKSKIESRVEVVFERGIEGGFSQQFNNGISRRIESEIERRIGVDFQQVSRWDLEGEKKVEGS